MSIHLDPNRQPRTPGANPGEEQTKVPKPEPGTLFKIFNTMQGYANACIRAIINYVNFRETIRGQLIELIEAIRQFNMNRLFVYASCCFILPAAFGEWSISYEVYEDFGYPAALVVFGLFRFLGTTGASLVAHGLTILKNNRRRALILLIAGLLLVLICLVVVTVLAWRKAEIYAEQSGTSVDVFQIIIPPLVFIVECVFGYPVERLLNHKFNEATQARLKRQLETEIQRAIEAQAKMLECEGKYAEVYERLHGHPPDLREDYTAQMLYVKNVVIHPEIDIAPNDPNGGNTPPAPVVQDDPTGPSAPSGDAAKGDDAAKKDSAAHAGVSESETTEDKIDMSDLDYKV